MAGQLSILKVLDLVPFGHAGVRGRFYALRLTPPVWPGWQAGQYVMLRPQAWGPEMPWPRPFSICLVTPRDLVVFFQVVGRGTERLLELRPGDGVRVMGPLGNGFAVEQGTPTLMLAGGMGVVPFVGYTHAHPTPWTLHLDFGHRVPLDCYPYENFNDKIPAENYEERCLDDRERFFKVVDGHIAAHAAQKGLVLACGPMPFLRRVQILCSQHGARAQISLEKRIACGLGACLGCVVKKRAGAEGAVNKVVPAGAEDGLPVPTCTHGPVFWADEVDLAED